MENLRMSELLNIKLMLLSSFYLLAASSLLLFQAANDWASQMPDTTLAGIGLLMSAFGGLMSWLWEKKKNENASLRTNITFALGIGVMVGLLTYNSLCVQRQMVAVWLAVLMASGFSNQMLWGMVVIKTKKGFSKIFEVEASTDGKE
jgi:hypothetical protein